MATEKRLIDANVVLAKKFTTGLSDASGNYYGYADVVFADDIENAPTVDAVEVVRCKDCMWSRPKDHREPTDTPRELICQCFKHHHIPAPWGARMAVNPDDFCSYGERKSDG